MKKKTHKKVTTKPLKKSVRTPRKHSAKFKELSLKLNYIAFAIAAVIFLAIGCFVTVLGFNPGYDRAVGYSDHARIDYKTLEELRITDIIITNCTDDRNL